MAKSKEVAETGGGALADYKERLGAMAQDVVSEERPSTAVLSLAGGIMTYLDMPIEGNSLDVVVLAAGTERTFYDRPYNPDDRGPPDCYAQTTEAREGNLIPASNVPEPPAASCAECPYSQWGSAKYPPGRGQACKLRRKLVCAPANTSLRRSKAGQAGP